MTSPEHRIYALDRASQAKIESSVQIASLNSVVVSLITNALDAEARRIKVVLNYKTGFCSVTDDGHGISAPNFQRDGNLAQPYCTSNLAQSDDCYGRHGQFLAALAGVALISIASCSDADAAHVLWLDDSGRLGHAQGEWDGSLGPTGTKVEVHGFLSKFPVRRKHLSDRFSLSNEVQKEFEYLKYDLTSLILCATRGFELELRHADSSLWYRYKFPRFDQVDPKSHPIPSMEQTLQALRQAGYISHVDCHEWEAVAINSGQIEVNLNLSKIPMPHKKLQFLSMNRLPLTRESHLEMFQAINNLFDNSSFGALDNDDAGGPENGLDSGRTAAKEREIKRKGVDRHPMFVIRCVTNVAGIDHLSEGPYTSHRLQDLLARAMLLIEVLIKEFLTSHGFSQLERKSRRKVAGTTATSSHAVNRYSVDGLENNAYHWSHIKSSRGAALDNILTGLPFRKAKRTTKYSNHKQQDTEIDRDFQILCPAKPGNSYDGIEPKNTMPTDDLAESTDGQTSNLLHVDARTGEVVQAPARGVSDESQNRLLWNHSSPDNRRTTRPRNLKPCSVAETAANAQHYSTQRSPSRTQAIRSFALFDSSVDSVQDYRKRVEHLWNITPTFDGSAAHAFEQLETHRISKEALRNARILGQADRKFVLAMVATEGCTGCLDHHLILVDQHAADERCKVEQLLKSVLVDAPVYFASPLVFELSSSEMKRLGDLRAYFARFNIFYNIVPPRSFATLTEQVGACEAKHQIEVTGLPTAIAERCRLSPGLIIDMLREESWADTRRRATSTSPAVPGSNTLHDALSHAPSRLLDMVNSRACRSAIMFNDELTHEQCEQLMRHLGMCNLPFQCAHGRPSMIVLAATHHLPLHDALVTALGSPTPSPKAFPQTSETQHAKQATDRNVHDSESECSNDAGDPSDNSPTPATTPGPLALISSLQAGSSLNKINATPSFGEAYRSWTASTSSTATTG